MLGSTGSIGRQALEVIGWFPDRLRVVGLATNRSINLLEEQVVAHGVPYAAVVDSDAAKEFGQLRPCLAGPDSLKELASLPEADIVLVAVTGIAGLVPTLEAINTGKTVALANKETLVAGGSLVMNAARRRGVQVIPVDSEHSAIYQCLQGQEARSQTESVAKLILTGSGGPFRGLTREQLRDVTPEQALRHPTWQMGAKITIDSATQMNKGLEVIEARWLFGVDYPGIEVLIHPQSIVHGLVVYRDGVVIAQLGRARHAGADPVCAYVSGACAQPAGRTRPGRSCRVDLRQTGPGNLSLSVAGYCGRDSRRYHACGFKRRQRGGSDGFLAGKVNILSNRWGCCRSHEPPYRPSLAGPGRDPGCGRVGAAGGGSTGSWLQRGKVSPR